MNERPRSRWPDRHGRRDGAPPAARPDGDDEPEPGVFDNRYMLGPADLPDAAALRAQGIPLFPISARTGEGVPELLEALWRRVDMVRRQTSTPLAAEG